ncbi:MAG: Sulfate transporter family protein [Synergistetes bacterium ADurb.Bin155]|jgi:hypothetical protein|nr:putative sulfate/molybdate transporter [Synergistales bacterium]MBP8996132.1 putative sulfate/molybdate transporter [Synergistales bacterium]NMD17232.1 hypothetical protein [Synergistaceae bacterium]OQB46392.1 MAG: Sulfate transporter family protein [Synergistetes bacterium ADurb.Bin155]HQL02542.1 putative sulfate/molybdate transporter [Synergistales bacterium]
MAKIGSFEFSLREFGGSLGDLGTLLPLAVGYITVCGVDPAGMLVFLGLANIITGVVYRLPMPIEPMKVLAVMAIAQAWSPDKIFASGLAMGITWLLLGFSGAITWVGSRTPQSVIRGIQLSLGLLLAIQGFRMIDGAWILAALSLLIILLLRDNPFAPASLVLVGGGILMMAFKGDLSHIQSISFSLPPLKALRPELLWPAMRDGGFSQVPLTATNAVIATSALITRYWPGRFVSTRQLSLNMGFMNLLGPFMGGIPLCHGAGGLAGQYYYGARTGGANVMEGVLEILLGLFLAGHIASIFRSFPMAIVGSMMIMVGVEMAKFVGSVRAPRDWAVVAVTAGFSVYLNMAAGFAAGLVAAWALGRLAKGR